VKSPRSLRIYAFFATTALWLMVQCFTWSKDEATDFNVMGLMVGSMAYVPIIIMALLDEIWNHSERPLQNWGNLLISQAMIATPMASLCLIYFLDKWILLALFVLIWVNDTGAYCVGSLTAKSKNGNHKMTPHISPKKSWEGLFGGIAFTIGAAFILNRFGWFKAISVTGLELWIAGIFGFLVSSFGTMGDLMESLFKRSIGVKDSGMFLPGHGGVLDRFDSALLAAPILATFAWLCYFIAPLL
jgi:phosphatidate cytidylyltransferase